MYCIIFLYLYKKKRLMNYCVTTKLNLDVNFFKIFFYYFFLVTTSK